MPQMYSAFYSPKIWFMDSKTKKLVLWSQKPHCFCLLTVAPILLTQNGKSSQEETDSFSFDWSMPFPVNSLGDYIAFSLLPPAFPVSGSIILSAVFINLPTCLQSSNLEN